MTDKKNIINPDEDFELEGLSNFVENLNNEESDKDSSDNNSEEVSNDELPSYLNNEDEEFNLDDFTSDTDDFNLDSLSLDDQEEASFEGESLDDSLSDLTNEIEALEENHSLSDDDNISAEEFQNLSESNKIDEDNFDIFNEESNQDFNMEGITELGSDKNNQAVHNTESNDVLGEDFTFDSSDSSSDSFNSNVEENNSQEDWNNDTETNDWDNNDSIFDSNDTEELLNNDFETVDTNTNVEEDFNFDEDIKLDQEDIHTTSGSNYVDNNYVDNNDEFSNDLDNQWDNTNTSDDFDDETVAADKDGSITPLPVPVPVPVKQGFFDKIKSKFSKKSKEEKEEELVEPDSNLNNHSSSKTDDLNVLDDFDDKPVSTSLLSDDKTPDEIEEEQKAKAKKSNIMKLSGLAIAVALAAGGVYFYKTNMAGMDDTDSYAMENTGSPVADSSKVQDLNTSHPVETLTPNSVKGIGATSASSLSTSQIEDLKKEILAQVSSERTALEQRVVNLEKENTVLKKVINEVQTSIDPDTINRFKVEFNDLNSKTKQLQVQFDDDQASNKTMATNFYAVLKKLNEDVQRVEQSAATQNSLDEQIKRIDNSFKQIVKMKDKEAEDNLTYRVDLIEKRMKFRNPNNDRSFEDKNNVKKVLSEGLFEGDTVKQEQQIPDIKYKYSFVGMIEGVMYLKTNSGDIKDFKVGDILPGYGEILKINDNGSMETEKQGTVSFK